MEPMSQILRQNMTYFRSNLVTNELHFVPIVSAVFVRYLGSLLLQSRHIQILGLHKRVNHSQISLKTGNLPPLELQTK